MNTPITFKTNKFKQRITLSIIILINLINFIFALKYFSRGVEQALLLSSLYIVLLMLMFIALKKINVHWIKNDCFYYLVVAIYSVGHIILFRFIHVESLNVDRWSVISSFWEQVFNHKYPYYAKSHMGNPPGPLPVYFLLTLPFSIIHEIGLLSLLGFVVFMWHFRKTQTANDSNIALLFVVLSIAVFWEISVRSTVLVNAVIFYFCLYWLLYRIELKNARQLWISAIVCGLVLSTRSIFILPLIIFSVYSLKNKQANLKQMTLWTIILLTTFAITFLPIILFYFHDFLKVNPFNIQTNRLLPLAYVPVFLIIAALAGYYSRNKTEVIFSCGVVLFSVFIVYFVHKGTLQGFHEAYYNSIIDLSYSLFSLPFLIYSLSDVDKLTQQID